ncbi:MAG TPA: hypothetical protein DHW82_10540 [Spirochaetia bacterium]|nr:MAG: hypothetical protein A2Y41_00280 [Spirochaetes bacterium GWB1_36_13]HCL57430.1 hypothetical protein [Spirochaetia bacterium]
MKILETLLVKNCQTCDDPLDTYEILLDSPVPQQFIFFLQKKMILKYFPSLLKPFFHGTYESCFALKGIEGNCVITLECQIENKEKSFQILEKWLNEV